MHSHLPTLTGHGRPLLVRGAAVVTLDPAIGTLSRGDVLIRGDVIAAVGPDLSTVTGPDTEIIDGTGTVAIPGFVDAHLHAWEGLLRGLAPTADFGSYLGLTAFGHGPRCRPADNYAGTLATAVAALDAGITTIVDNGHNALTPAHAVASVEALRDAGIRAVHAVGSPFGSELTHVPGTAVHLRDTYAGGLIGIRLFDIDPTTELWRFAADHGLWVSSELGPHTPALLERFETLAAAGLLTPQHAFNHCYDLPPRVWELIADSGAAVNLCPRSDAAFGLGSTVPPVREAVRHAAAIGLSNDNETSYSLSMFAEMQTLLLRDRADRFRRAATAGEDPGVGLSPWDLLRFATLGGAHNAGLAGTVGSLTPGKQADLLLVRVDGPAALSAADPVTAVTTMAHPGLVDTVLVAGRVRKRAGRLVGLDTDGARQLITASRAHLLGTAVDATVQRLETV